LVTHAFQDNLTNYVGYIGGDKNHLQVEEQLRPSVKGFLHINHWDEKSQYHIDGLLEN